MDKFTSQEAEVLQSKPSKEDTYWKDSFTQPQYPLELTYARDFPFSSLSLTEGRMICTVGSEDLLPTISETHKSTQPWSRSKLRRYYQDCS